MGRACSMHGVNEKFIQILGCKPEVKRPLARISLGWEDNTKMYLRKAECDGVD
jgi:hypothetical protein